MKLISKRVGLLFILTLLIVMQVIPIYAVEDDIDTPTNIEEHQKNTADEYTLEGDKDNIETNLSNMFSRDMYKGDSVGAGIKLAQPFVYIIHVFSIFIIIVVSYLFIGVTGLDLAYIIVPPIRGLLMKRRENSGGHNRSTGGFGADFMCISDSCVAAVHGSGGTTGGTLGGTGGGIGNDRGVGSSLIRYVGDRTKEFVVFMLFVLFFLTGMIGRLTVMLFRLFTSLFEGLANFV